MPHSPGPAPPSGMGHNPQHLRCPHPIPLASRFYSPANGPPDLNAHFPLWDTNQPSDTRCEQLENLVIAHSASVLNNGTAALLNCATGGRRSPDVSLAHSSLTDKAEWTVGEDLKSDLLPITIELRYQTPVASDPHKRARWNTKDVNWQACAPSNLRL